MQGRERGEGMSKSEMGLRSLGQGSRIRARNREGRAGLSMQSSENRTKVCDRWDMRWKVLERVWVVGMHGLEFWCGVTRSVTAM